MPTRQPASTSPTGASRATWAARIESAAACLPVIRNAETYTIADIWSDTFHHTPTHELVHVQQGRAEIQFRNRAFQVGPEDTFIIPQGLDHRDHRADQIPCRFSYVFFEWPSGDALLRKIPLAVFSAMPASLKAHLHFLMGELEREFLSDDAGSTDHLRVLLLEILLAILRHAHRASPNRADRPARTAVARATRQVAQHRRQAVAHEARQFLRENFSQPLSLDALAARLDVSPFHLSRIFSREFGLGLSDMLTMIRIEQARHCLHVGTLPVKAIAHQVGYSDANYFAKVFRRVCGCSPTQYQIQHRRREK